MPKYKVDVEIVRSFVVEVEAETPQAARAKVENDEVTIDTDKNYVDSHVDVCSVYDENDKEILETMEG